MELMMDPSKLSSKAVELLTVLFSETSNIQVPIGLAAQVIEIREWIAEQATNGTSDAGLKPLQALVD